MAVAALRASPPGTPAATKARRAKSTARSAGTRTVGCPLLSTGNRRLYLLQESLAGPTGRRGGGLARASVVVYAGRRGAATGNRRRVDGARRVRGRRRRRRRPRPRRGR